MAWVTSLRHPRYPGTLSGARGNLPNFPDPASRTYHPGQLTDQCGTSGEDPVKEPIRVMLVEDQAMVRQGLRYIIDAQPGLTVVGEAADGEEAIQAALAKKPDVILMDIRMPGKNGIEATRAILQTLPDTKIILLTTFDIQEYVYEGMRAGAVGYLLKSAETQALLDGIREAYQGAVIYRSTSSGKAIAQALENVERIPSPQERRFALLEHLTEREQEVLQ